MEKVMDEIFKIDDEYSFLTRELLTKEYIENKLTDRQIAQKYNVNGKVTVWRRRKFFGIKNNTPSKSNKNASKNRVFNISREDAVKYISDGLTYKEIAVKMGCGRMVVYRRIKEMGLIDNRAKSMSRLKLHESLNEQQINFFLGCLLGDGNITHDGMFQCNHSYKQLEYIKYKRAMLHNLLSPNFTMERLSVSNNQNGKTYFKYFLRTMANESIKNIYHQYYVNRKKIFPLLYLKNSTFDAYSLAIWYMDDGSRKGNTPSLYTFSFGYEGNLDILKFLKIKFDIEGTIKEDFNPERSEGKKHFISFTNDFAKEKFFNMVAPYIIPCFQYKLPEKYRTKQ